MVLQFSFFIDCGMPLLLGGCERMSGGPLVLQFLRITFLDFAFLFLIDCGDENENNKEKRNKNDMIMLKDTQREIR